MRAPVRWERLLLTPVLLLAASASTAHATDFEVDAQTIGQGYQLKAYDQAGATVLLDRRRLT